MILIYECLYNGMLQVSNLIVDIIVTNKKKFLFTIIFLKR